MRSSRRLEGSLVSSVHASRKLTTTFQELKRTLEDLDVKRLVAVADIEERAWEAVREVEE